MEVVNRIPRPTARARPHGLDLLAVSALVYGLFLPRHRRIDLVVVYALFNVGLFLALVVISAGEVSMGVGFGLFAVLSIVRLRSEPFSNRELAYFFVALVLALVTRDRPRQPRADRRAALRRAAGDVGVRPSHQPQRRLLVTLEQAFADGEALRRHLETRLGARVLDISVLEVDYVRETTHADVRYTTPSEGGPACRRGARMTRSRSTSSTRSRTASTSST